MAAGSGRSRFMGALITLALASLWLIGSNSAVSANVGEPISADTYANATTQPNSRGRLAKRAVIENKTAEEVQQLMNIYNFNKGAIETLQELNRKEPKKHVQFYDELLSHSGFDKLVKSFKINVAYERLSELDPGVIFVVAFNETVILTARKVDRFYYWEFGQNLSALVIFFLIVVGNLSILHRLKSCRRRRSNVNYFIVQLAIADLFVGFFNVTLDLFLRYQKEFNYGPMACSLYKYMSVLFIYSSTYLLVSLSIDRWEAVVKPLAFTRNRSRGYYLVAGSWLLSLVCAFPVALNTDIERVGEQSQCWVNYSPLGWKIYMIYLTSTLLVIPALIIAVCYAHIVYTIWSKGRLVSRQQQQLQRQHQLGLRKPRSASSKMANQTNTTLSEASSATDVADCDAEPAASNKLNSSTTVQNNGAQVITITSSKRATSFIEHDDLSGDTEDDYVSTDEEEVEEEYATDGAEDEEDGLNPKPAFQSNGFEMCQVVSVQDKPEKSNGHKEQSHSAGRTVAAKVSISGEPGRDRVSPPQTRLNEDEAPQEIAGGSTKTARRGTKEPRRSYVGQQHGSGVIPRARIKTIKMTLVIVAAFILCWSPFYIINLCTVFGLMKADNALSTLSQSLAHLNSAVNPIIFWLFSSKRNSSTAAASSDTRNSSGRGTIRDPIRRVFCWRLCCFARGPSGFATDSRMFDSTGASAVAGSMSLTSSIKRKAQITK